MPSPSMLVAAIGTLVACASSPFVSAVNVTILIGQYPYPQLLRAATARGLDFPGNDVGNMPAARADDCFNTCRFYNPACYAYTWTNYQGGTCFFKSTRGQTSLYVGAESAFMFTEEYEDATKSESGVFDDCDMPGSDLGQAPGVDVDACNKGCWENKACKAVTWTSYNGGTCFFKTDVRECVSYPGAKTRVVFNHFVKP